MDALIPCVRNIRESEAKSQKYPKGQLSCGLAVEYARCTLGPSHPGIDLAGSQQKDYPPWVVTISAPCSGGISPHWVVHALEAGFDGVFVAADGGGCVDLPDCTARTAAIVETSQALLREQGHVPRRVKMAAICSVCSEPFVSHMRQFSEALNKL
jgi:F420-non-reducing hydrogenase iron-sulfur subunit